MLLCTIACFAREWEVGAFAGYGWHRNASVSAPAGKAQAGIRNRFTAGAVFTHDTYEHFSGEVRYLYQDGDPFLNARGVRVDQQGQSHTFVYDLLFQARRREHRIRPYVAVGLGAKLFRVSGPPLAAQPLSDIATLTTRDDVRVVLSAGVGVKYRVSPRVVLRLDFRDYITPFPKILIQPAPFAAPRGFFQQFTPMVGIGYAF